MSVEDILADGYPTRILKVGNWRFSFTVVDDMPEGATVIIMGRYNSVVLHSDGRITERPHGNQRETYKE